ncbi:MAG: MFS transporter [Deltaproteobacteria bacterium]|nr:MFS transporter [Deltaproteobacteria bacterium]
MVEHREHSDTLRGQARVLLGAALGAGVSHTSLAFLSFGVFLKPLTAAFGWDRVQISSAISLATLIVAFGTPPLGRLVDRWGERRILFPAMAGYALLFAALSLQTGALWLFFALFIAATIAGIGSNSVVYVRIIAARFDRNRGLALGLAMAGVGLGAATIPPLTQHLIDRYGWRGAYLGLAAVVLISIPIVAGALRERTSANTAHGTLTADRKTAPSQGLSAAEARRTRSFWTLGAVVLLAAVAIHGFSVHLIPLLTDRGSSPQAAAGAASLFGIGILFGRIVAGYLMDRFFAPRVAALFFAGPLLGMAVLIVEAPPAAAPICAFLLGIGAGAEVDVIGYLTSRYYGLREFAQIYGWFYAAFMIGTGLGPLLVGVGFEATGSYALPLLGAAGCLVLLCVLLLSLGAYPDWELEPDSAEPGGAR